VKLAAVILIVGLGAANGIAVRAQAGGDALTAKEIESLRDAAYVPTERIGAYIDILNDRERIIDDLLVKPKHVTFDQDMHDVLDQFATIADELNDNLDELNGEHRDLRKALPKLLRATEKWTTALRAPGDNEAYKVVRRSALDALKDMHDIALQMEASEDTYFREHPDAAKKEKERYNNPHAPE
jgi:hypothetical protein